MNQKYISVNLLNPRHPRAIYYQNINYATATEGILWIAHNLIRQHCS